VDLLTATEIERQCELPDSCRRLSWAGSRLVAACDDGSIMFDQHPSGSLMLLAELASPPTSLAASADHFVCGALDGSLFNSSHPEVTLHRTGRIGAVAFVGAHVIAARGNTIEVISDPPGDPVDLGVGVVTGLAPITRVMAVVAGCAGMAWHDVSSALSDGRLALSTIVAIAPDPMGRCVALGDLGGSVHLVRSGTEDAVELAGFPDRVALLGWVSSGDGLCVIADDELTLWKPDDRGFINHDQPDQMVAHDVMITALSPSPSDRLVATGDASGVVHIWAPTLVDLPVATLYVSGTVLALAWRPDGRKLAVTTSVGELTLVSVLPGSMA